VKFICILINVYTVYSIQQALAYSGGGCYLIPPRKFLNNNNIFTNKLFSDKNYEKLIFNPLPKQKFLGTPLPTGVQYIYNIMVTV